MKKVYFLQRALAYLIDYLVITVIGIIFGMFLISNSDDYTKAVNSIDELAHSYTQGEIDNKEYIREYGNLAYEVEKDTAFLTIVELIVSIGYFGTFAYYNGGMTLGKKVMKIKVSTDCGEELSHGKFILRASFISFTYTKCLTLFAVLFIGKDSFYKVYLPLELFRMIFIVVTVIMVLKRKDTRGIHDLIVGSQVESCEKQ